MHEHNCAIKEFARDYHFGEDARRENILPVEEQPTFQGYRRANGKVGTRNYLAILTSVNCSATVARLIAKEVERSDLLADYPNVDGVIALVHGTGCGIAAKGEGFDALMRTQWGYAGNPNIGATLMVGLGCEVFQIGRMKEEYGIVESETFHSMTIQATGGTRKTVEAGIERIRAMLPMLNRAERDADARERADACAPVRRLGRLFGHHRQSRARRRGRHSGAQRRHGDSFGDAGDLRRRAFADPARRDAGDRPQARRAHPLVGGLLRPQRRRDEQQSLARKQGRRPDDHPREIARARRRRAARPRSTRSIEYAEPVTAKGFVFMDTPGYDPVSATGQVAGGANVLCFTTGRGSAYGCKPTPSVKLATNNDTYRRMIEDMDINCGDVVDGVSIADKGQEIFDKVLAVASGERTKSELSGYGDAEFAPWQIGATM